MPDQSPAAENREARTGRATGEADRTSLPDSPAAFERHVYAPGIGGWCIRCGARKRDPRHVAPPVSFFDLAKELPNDDD
jgi:hypothetical protein